MNTQELKGQAIDQYADLRDTILTLEAMSSDSLSPVSWNNLKKNLKNNV